MDAYEATRIIFSRIQSIDPENAAKIMGFLLIQDHGDKEMIRLAFGPESHIHSLILKACNELGLSPTASPFFPLSRQNSSRLLRSHSSASADFNVLSPNGFHHNVKKTTLMNFISKTTCLSSTKAQKTLTCFSPLPTLPPTPMLCSSIPSSNWGVNNEQHRREPLRQRYHLGSFWVEAMPLLC
ncbi:hypothetical protein IFM89_008379 [Coptis chinensis]|uniref:AtC3H46-like PABC-like domain-containing protein n=1 Tax=Coptis chinensis TaxID=261450 RepID=A0A835M7X2_9MAGN|nr:hypothetical protein IFM89_008379 [Coptis chinensis]